MRIVDKLAALCAEHGKAAHDHAKDAYREVDQRVLARCGMLLTVLSIVLDETASAGEEANPSIVAPKEQLYRRVGRAFVKVVS